SFHASRASSPRCASTRRSTRSSISSTRISRSKATTRTRISRRKWRCSSAHSRSAARRLAEERLAEATELLKTRHWSGAYYLAGYAAELALKAVIAGQFVAGAIPDKRLVNAVYTHN